MTYRLIDVSGSVTHVQMKAALGDCKAGDPVIAFSCDPTNLGAFTNVTDMLDKVFTASRGGTMIAPALQLVPHGAAAVIYTDGYIFDGKAAVGRDVTFVLYPTTCDTTQVVEQLGKIAKEVRFL